MTTNHATIVAHQERLLDAVTRLAAAERAEATQLRLSAAESSPDGYRAAITETSRAFSEMFTAIYALDDLKTP